MPSFFYFGFVMFERNLSAFPFSNFINFLFQPLRFVCKSDVRQIFVGLILIVREIYVLSFEIVVLCLLLFTSSSLLFALPSMDFAFDTIFPL